MTRKTIRSAWRRPGLALAISGALLLGGAATVGASTRSGEPSPLEAQAKALSSPTRPEQLP
jgi:hypothetical protein